MSIFDMFRGSGSSQAASEGLAPAAAEGEVTSIPPGGEVPPGGEAPASGEGSNLGGDQQGEVSGLDAFKDLWNNDAGDKEGGKEKEFDPSSSLNIDPAAIQKAVAEIDFSQVMDKDTVAKIAEGGDGAQAAFATSMNSLAQHVFSQSMIANATLVKQALSQSTGAFDSRAQQLMRQDKISSTVKDSNPAFKHPSAAPIVEAMQSQLSKKYPTASPQEISEKATQWFGEFASEIQAPERKKKESQKKADEPDWEAFFGENES